jgi:hypothetical protein
MARKARGSSFPIRTFYHKLKGIINAYVTKFQFYYSNYFRNMEYIALILNFHQNFILNPKARLWMLQYLTMVPL